MIPKDASRHGIRYYSFDLGELFVVSALCAADLGREESAARSMDNAALVAIVRDDLYI
jgi:hypothetical protein